MFKIETLQGHERMSTQDLLLAIGEAVQNGETEFEIAASGQHDIGGPLWHPEGKTLHFHVTNAGQRVGSMCLPNTEIVVDGSTSADVGWLNAGGIINVGLEYLGQGNRAEVEARIARIPDRLVQVWDESEASGKPHSEVADAIARRLIGRG